MRVFAFEFFSGGGLLGQPLPPGPVREGDLMLRTLTGELAKIAGVTVVASRDARLPPLARGETLLARPGESPGELFARGVAEVDAVWPTAPETDAALERLASTTIAAGRGLLGCRPEAVRLAASKRRTARTLAAAGVPVVPTFGPGEALPPIPGAWAVKPDDGAGCDGLEQLPGHREAEERLAGGTGLVAQPRLEGDSWSLSLLCAGGRARLLSCNRQQVRWPDGRAHLDAIVVNDRPPLDRRILELGARVAGAIPGLWGYVGVDFLLAPQGPVVLEVNPRLTTSYCGLPAALGRNVAGLVLELRRTGELPPPTAAPRRSVEIALGSTCAA